MVLRSSTFSKLIPSSPTPVPMPRPKVPSGALKVQEMSRKLYAFMEGLPGSRASQSTKHGRHNCPRGSKENQGTIQGHDHVHEMDRAGRLRGDLQGRGLPGFAFRRGLGSDRWG